jgi:signal peptidase II
MLGVATAGAVADVAVKLWAVSQLPYLRATRTIFGVDLVLVFNRTPSFDYKHLVIGQTLLVMVKFVALAYLGWRLKGWWRWLGLGLILGGAIANVGNWLLTRAVPDFLVMPWATVNLADLLIVTGAAVICAGWGARVLTRLIRRRRRLILDLRHCRFMAAAKDSVHAPLPTLAASPQAADQALGVAELANLASHPGDYPASATQFPWKPNGTRWGKWTIA